MEDFEVVLSQETQQQNMQDLKKCKSSIETLEKVSKSQSCQLETKSQELNAQRELCIRAQIQAEESLKQLDQAEKTFKLEEQKLQEGVKQGHEEIRKLKGYVKYKQQLEQSQIQERKLKSNLQQTTEKLFKNNQQIIQMKEYQDGLEQDLTASHRELSEQKKKQMQIENQILVYQKNISQSMQENENLVLKMKEIQSQKQQKEQEINLLKANNENLKVQLQQCAVQLEKNTKEFSKYEQVRNELQREREKLFQENGLLKDDCRELMKAKEIEFNQNVENKNLICSMQKEISYLKQQNQEILLKNSDIEQQFAEQTTQQQPSLMKQLQQPKKISFQTVSVSIQKDEQWARSRTPSQTNSFSQEGEDDDRNKQSFYSTGSNNSSIEFHSTSQNGHDSATEISFTNSFTEKQDLGKQKPPQILMEDKIIPNQENQQQQQQFQQEKKDQDWIYCIKNKVSEITKDKSKSPGKQHSLILDTIDNDLMKLVDLLDSFGVDLKYDIY